MAEGIIKGLARNPELLYPPKPQQTFLEILKNNAPATYDLVDSETDEGRIRFLFESPDGRTIEFISYPTEEAQLPAEGVWLELNRFKGWLVEDSNHTALYWDHEDLTLCVTARPARKEAVTNMAFQIFSYLSYENPTALENLAE